MLLYRYRTVLLGTFVHTHNEMDSLRQDKALWKMIQKSPKIQREFDFERRTYLESHSHDALTIRCEFDVLFRLRAHYLRGPRSPLGRCATDRRSTSNCFFSLKKILCLLNIASFDSHMLCAQYQPRSFYFEASSPPMQLFFDRGLERVARRLSRLHVVFPWWAKLEPSAVCLSG